MAADRVHPGPRGEKRRARVDAVGASTQILAERAFHDGELGAEILAPELATRLLSPADVIDAVERNVVEQRRRGREERADHKRNSEPDRDAECPHDAPHRRPPGRCGQAAGCTVALRRNRDTARLSPRYRLE